MDARLSPPTHLAQYAASVCDASLELRNESRRFVALARIVCDESRDARERCRTRRAHWVAQRASLSP
jgi:hypothetical protein